MKIRSVTYFDDPGHSLDRNRLDQAGEFASSAQKSFESDGFELQSVRFATVPFPLVWETYTSKDIIARAVDLERILLDFGYAYISLGPALPSHPQSYDLIPDLIRATSATFCSGLLTLNQDKISLQAVRACGNVILNLLPQDPNGFANLYFAALGNVLPGAPFFPAAYAGKETPCFAIAVEGADLAVDAFQGAATFQEAQKQLISAIETHADQISTISQALEKNTGAVYTGIDFSLAPFPDVQLSAGTALESLGLSKLGEPGSIAAAAFLADTIDQASFQRTGFSGLMLPVLEDSILAQRAAEGSLGIKDLLLYSAVCGTGLDTIPLPGDISQKQLGGILLDLAALSLRLNKPLTARLMPIPGKKAGDPTSFDFPFFANSKVMDVEGGQLSNCFDQDGYLELKPRL